MSNEDVRKFIITTVNSLDKDISLPSFDIVVYPESISELNRNMLGYLNRLAQPQVVNMDAIKSLPSKIGFDYDRFEIEVLQLLKNMKSPGLMSIVKTIGLNLYIQIREKTMSIIWCI